MGRQIDMAVASLGGVSEKVLLRFLFVNVIYC